MLLKSKYIFTLCIGLCLTNILQAQRRPSIPGSGGGSSSYPTSAPTQNTATNEAEEPDTATVIFFYAQRPDIQYAMRDTLLDNHFQQYLPTRKRNDEYATLGYMGSAARPLVWRGYERMGFDEGWHQFDVYRFRNEDFRYYNTQKSFSQGFWSGRSLGDDSQLDFEYGGHFDKNVFLSLQWHRVNMSQSGSYKFARQRALNTNWGVSVGQIKTRYQWFLSMASNGFEQEDNGGLVSDTTLKKTLQGTVNDVVGGNSWYVTRLSQAMRTNFTHRDIQWKHQYWLNPNNANGKRLSLTHQTDYQIFKYKTATGFSNTSTLFLRDSSYIGELLTDRRGARLAVETQRIDNQFLIAFAKNDLLSTKGARNPFGVGIKHSWVGVNQEVDTKNVHNLFAIGHAKFDQFSRFRLNTNAHLGLSKAVAGEYRADATVFFDLKPIGTLEGQLVQQRFQPTLLEQSLYNARREVWQNDFKKLFYTSLSATYRLPKIGFSAQAAFHVINNYIYFNEKLKPTQENSAVSLFQLNISQSLKYGHVGLDNFVSLQQSSNDVLRVPTLTGKHSLYIEGKVLRKRIMLARFGIDIRYVSDYKSEQYNAFLGQFHWQDTETMLMYPSVDAYISAKVTKTRVFVKMENLTRYWYRDRVFYQVLAYPQYDSYFRIGIHRRFTD